MTCDESSSLYIGDFWTDEFGSEFYVEEMSCGAPRRVALSINPPSQVGGGSYSEVIDAQGIIYYYDEDKKYEYSVYVKTIFCGADYAFTQLRTCLTQLLCNITVDVIDQDSAKIDDTIVNIVKADDPNDTKTCTTDINGTCLLENLKTNTDYVIMVSKSGYACNIGCGTFNSGSGGTIYVTMRETGCLSTFLPNRSLIILGKSTNLLLSGQVVNVDSEISKEIGIIFTRPDGANVEKIVGTLQPCESSEFEYNFGTIDNQIIGKWVLEQCEIVNDIWNVTEVAFIQVQRPFELNIEIIINKPTSLYPLIGLGLGALYLTKKE